MPALTSRLSTALLLLLFMLSPAQASAEEVEVPINIGLGPAFHMFSGAIEEDQTLHYGMMLSIGAVLDEELIKANQHKVPKKYRKYIKNTKEVRISPWYIPDTLFISPQQENTMIYGVVFRPISAAKSIRTKLFRLSLSLGVELTYAYMDSTVLETTHFFRPGLDLRAELEIPFGKYFLLSGGWTSFFHIPQTLGESPIDNPFNGDGENLWHIGQFFGLVHFRVPYKTSL